MLKNWIWGVLLLCSTLGYSQKNLAWPVLAMTTHEVDPISGLYKPQFPNFLESQYEGEEVIIAGYLIPMEVDQNRYALSKNPFSSCFFCGNAGPETVIELRFSKDPGRFATDRFLPVKGILKLNRNGESLFFTLENAEIGG